MPACGLPTSGRPPNPRASQSGKWPNAEITLPIDK